jgi:hypothetical protein
MPRWTRRKTYAAVGAAVFVVAGSGVAYAYWTSTGSGTGTATTGTSDPWTVTIDSTTNADLTPGGPTDTITFHVTNPNTGVQHLNNTVASVVDTSDPGCTAADFSVGATSITYGDVASGATVDGTFTLQMVNSSGNQDACKNATVNLKVDAS